MSITKKCKIDNCTSEVKRLTAGYCYAHYSRVRRGETGSRLHRPILHKVGGVCSIKNCDRKHLAHGFCETHLTRYRRHGMKDIDRPIQEISDYPKKYPAEYDIWFNIKQRIYNKNCPAYHNYGGRGLTMEESWVHSFRTFVDHIGARPKKDLTLDRIDNGKGYVHGNLRWTDRVTQARNTRIRVSNKTGHKGVEKTQYGTWIARIGVNGRKINLGTYSSFKEARQLRIDAEKKYWG